MSNQRYTPEFKDEAVRQVTDRGHPVADVAERLGVTTHSIYNWLKKYGPKAAEFEANSEEAKKIKALEKELKRVTEERDILKKAAVYFASQSD